MVRNVLSLLVGLALGGGHFALFGYTIKRVLASDSPRKAFIVLSLAFRHLVLGAAFLGLWRLGLAPLPMALGIVVSYVVFRIVMLRMIRSGP